MDPPFYSVEIWDALPTLYSISFNQMLILCLRKIKRTSKCSRGTAVRFKENSEVLLLNCIKSGLKAKSTAVLLFYSLF